LGKVFERSPERLASLPARSSVFVRMMARSILYTHWRARSQK